MASRFLNIIVSFSGKDYQGLYKTLREALLLSAQLPVNVVLVTNEIDFRSTPVFSEFEDFFGALIVGDDNGIYDAWNKGLLKIRPGLVCFMGAGDYIDSGSSRFLRSLLARNDFFVAIGRVLYVHKTGRTRLLRQGFFGRAVFSRFKVLLPIFPELIFSASVFDEFRFDPSLRVCGDLDLMLYLREMVLNKKCHALVLDSHLVYMAGGGISSDYKTLYRRLKERRGVLQRYGIQQGLHNFYASYAINILGFIFKPIRGFL